MGSMALGALSALCALSSPITDEGLNELGSQAGQAVSVFLRETKPLAFLGHPLTDV